jgi:hypothetical protein
MRLCSLPRATCRSVGDTGKRADRGRRSRTSLPCQGERGRKGGVCRPASVRKSKARASERVVGQRQWVQRRFTRQVGQDGGWRRPITKGRGRYVSTALLRLPAIPVRSTAAPHTYSMMAETSIYLSGNNAERKQPQSKYSVSLATTCPTINIKNCLPNRLPSPSRRPRRL